MFVQCLVCLPQVLFSLRWDTSKLDILWDLLNKRVHANIEQATRLFSEGRYNESYINEAIMFDYYTLIKQYYLATDRPLDEVSRDLEVTADNMKEAKALSLQQQVDAWTEPD